MYDCCQLMHPGEEDGLLPRLVLMVYFEFGRKPEHHRRLREIT